jgi:hypothetical protein
MPKNKKPFCRVVISKINKIKIQLLLISPASGASMQRRPVRLFTRAPLTGNKLCLFIVSKGQLIKYQLNSLWQRLKNKFGLLLNLYLRLMVH